MAKAHNARAGSNVKLSANTVNGVLKQIFLCVLLFEGLCVCVCNGKGGCIENTHTLQECAHSTSSCMKTTHSPLSGVCVYVYVYERGRGREREREREE